MEKMVRVDACIIRFKGDPLIIDNEVLWRCYSMSSMGALVDTREVECVYGDSGNMVSYVFSYATNF